MQPPPEQVPWFCEQVPLLSATQLLLLLSQQPPSLHALPSQQGPPGAPHALQLPLSQVSPEATQKLLAPPRPFGLPLQQAWLSPPQGIMLLPPVEHCTLPPALA